jgi:hypothetical protein
MHIPYAREQGIISGEQGILAQEQGMLRAKSDIIAEQVFGTDTGPIHTIANGSTL